MTISIRAPVKDAEWNAYYDLRYRVLREPLNKPRGSERSDGDGTGLHFAMYDNDNLVAIARLDQPSENTSQARFVAVDTLSQRNGYGSKLMSALEEMAETRGDTQMILHARDYALDFYRKIGYEVVEKSYLLFDVLQHFLMKKQL